MATVFYLYRSTKQNAPLTVRLSFRHNMEDKIIGANSRVQIYSYEELELNPNLSALKYWKEHHTATKIKDIDILNKNSEINLKLKKLENHILKEFSLLTPDLVTKHWLEDIIEDFHNPLKNDEVPITLLEFIEFYLKMNNHLKHGTTKKFITLKNKIKSRIHQFPKGFILLTDINDIFKINYQHIFSDYNINTITRDLTEIKTLVRYAESKGVEVNKEVFRWKMKVEKTPFVYLKEDDIKSLHKLEGLTDHLCNAKDWLVISCLCGQRVSDFMRFTKQMIRYEKNRSGKEIPLIEFTQVKTNKTIAVPLHPIIIQILDSRNGDFPQAISSQKYNDYIKEVCLYIGFDDIVYGSKIIVAEDGLKRTEKGNFMKYELITSHCGRRSFATNNYGKIPTSLIMSVTGHSSEKMLLSYIGKSQTEQAKNLADYF